MHDEKRMVMGRLKRVPVPDWGSFLLGMDLDLLIDFQVPTGNDMRPKAHLDRCKASAGESVKCLNYLRVRLEP